MQNELENKKNNKILSNKAKNYLINLLSYLLNNKNNFEEKLSQAN